MKKHFFFCIALTLLLAGTARGQKPVSRIEVEPKIAANTPLFNYTESPSSPSIGAEIALEVRYNFEGGWDAGIEAYRSVTTRENRGTEVLDGRLICMMKGISLTGDYNLWRGESASIYAGCGIGAAAIAGPVNKAGISVILTPRFGIELWNRLRIGAQIRFASGYREADNLAVTLGYAIGGKPKKNTNQ